jgi:hypothetical protein
MVRKRSKATNKRRRIFGVFIVCALLASIVAEFACSLLNRKDILFAPVRLDGAAVFIGKG